MSVHLVSLDRSAAAGRIYHEIGIYLNGPGDQPVAAARGRIIGGAASAAPPPKNGIWLSDLPFVEAKALKCNPGRGHVHADGWLGLEWRQILAEWGMPEPVREDSAMALSRIAARLVALSISSANRMQHYSPAAAGIDDRRMVFRPSLAAGLRALVRPQLLKTRPAQRALHRVSRDLHLCGIGPARPPSPDAGRYRTLRLVRPRLGHVQAIAHRQIPSSGYWRRVELPNSSVALDDRLIAALRELDRPVVLVGGFQPYRLALPAWVRGWLAGYGGPYGRQCFTLEEAGCLHAHGEFFLAEAFAGPGWHRPAASGLLRDFLRALAAAAGSARIARNSWSAGLVAENFLYAMSRRPEEFRCAFSLETCWIAAHDRISAIPAIEAIESSGARLIRACGSTVCVEVRDRPESIRQLVQLLWRLGYAPIGGRRCIGADIACSPADFGGPAEDRDMAMVMLRGLFDLGGGLDALAGSPPGQRRQREQALHAQLAARLS